MTFVFAQVVGQTYKLRWYMKIRSTDDELTLQARIGRTTIWESVVTNKEWGVAEAEFVAEDSNVSISFVVTANTGDDSVFIDDIGLFNVSYEF